MECGCQGRRRRVWSGLGLLRAHANPTSFIKSHLGFRNRSPTGTRAKRSPERPAKNSRDKQTNKRVVSWPARINRQQFSQGAIRSYLRQSCTQNVPCPMFKSGDGTHTAGPIQNKLTQKAVSGDQFLKATTRHVTFCLFGIDNGHWCKKGYFHKEMYISFSYYKHLAFSSIKAHHVEHKYTSS